MEKPSSSLPLAVLITTLIWAILFAILKLSNAKVKFSFWQNSNTFNKLLNTPKRHSFSYSFLYFVYETTTYNNSFLKLARFKGWQIWFSFGILFGIVSFITACCLMLWSFGKSLNSLLHYRQLGPDNQVDWHYTGKFLHYSTGPLLDQPDPKQGQAVSLIIPGVTLPVFALGYYFSSFLITGLFHEAGHALSALTENISISSTGLFVMGVYPGAFVQLDHTSMGMLHPLRKLRIICAGVWHNIVLSFLAYLALYSLPFLLFPAYTNSCSPDSNNNTMQQGVMVLEVVEKSPLNGHIQPNTLITQIDNFPIRASQDLGILYAWERALHANYNSNKTGFCVEDPSSATNHQCCESVTLENPLGNLSDPFQCFHHIESQDSKCLPLHQSISKSKTCFFDSECSTRQQCMTPFIPHDHLAAMRIQLNTKTVVFVGDAREVWKDIRVGCFIPRFAFPTLPYFLERLLQYGSRLTFSFIFSLSLALSVFNMVPAWYLDGHYFLAALLEIGGRKEDRYWVLRMILNGTSAITTFIVLVSLWNGI